MRTERGTNRQSLDSRLYYRLMPLKNQQKMRTERGSNRHTLDSRANHNIDSTNQTIVKRWNLHG